MDAREYHGAGVNGSLQATIRALAASELATVDRGLRPAHPSVHATRLADQYAGQVLYLVAWIEAGAASRGTVCERDVHADDRPRGRPVGHVLIRWRGSSNPAVRAAMSRRGRHPYLEDLLVHPEFRSRSIGSQLLDAAEREALAHGYRQVGLAVALENVRARALYERQGYRDAEIGQFASRSSYLDGDGRLQTRVEMCVYLMKRVGQ